MEVIVQIFPANRALENKRNIFPGVTTEYYSIITDLRYPTIPSFHLNFSLSIIYIWLNIISLLFFKR